MTTHCRCGRRAITCSLVVIAAAVVSVVGKPYTQEDYTRAVLAQYFPTSSLSKVIELTPTELPEPTSFRSSRSDDRGVAKSPPPVSYGHPEVLQPQHHGASAQMAAVSAVPVPCKAVVADRSHGNDTSSAVTVEKLSAYYEQLKTQQEMLARQQFQQQLFEQQQRRQQEFSLMQQQIQQQYYQQTQHAMIMLDQMRRNPAFVGQLASFVDHKPTSTAHNETSLTAATPEAVKEVIARGGAKRPPTPQEKDQTIASHVMVVERDNDPDGSGAKRLDARQVARQKASPSSFSSTSSSSSRHQPVTYDDENDNGEDDTLASFEDDQTSPMMEKDYSMANE